MYTYIQELSQSEKLNKQEAQGVLSCSTEKHSLTCSFAQNYINLYTDYMDMHILIYIS